MKKVILALSLVFFLCSISTAEIKDSPDGFRGIKWGDPPSALGERVKIAVGRFVSFYTKDDEQMSIGVANLKSIEYVFIQDSQLSHVIIYAEGADNCTKLREAMIARYGTPLQTSQTKNLWGDKKNSISFEYDTDTKNAEVYIISSKMINKLNALKKQEAEQGVKDF